MSRTIPDCPNAPALQAGEQHPNSIIRTYTITVMTPLFGGGVEAGINDPVTLIRPSSIRGHLRFWWRATRGARFQKVEELRQREGEIWGTTKSPSPVTLEVKIKNPGEEEACATFPPGKNIPKFAEGYPAYVLFPFQGNAQEKITSSKARKDATFSLAVRYPQPMEQEVQVAVWAWVNFGGIGARTRRGCGALFCSKTQPDILGFHPPSVDRFSHWLIEKANHYQFPLLTNHEHRAWPTFFRAICLKTVANDAPSSWKAAIEVMREFRQGRNYGRDPGGSTPGRSRWPEPESVRTLVAAQQGMTSRPKSWHSPNPRIPAPNFPRAEFGMPIIFELRNESIPDPTSPNNRSPNLKPSLQPSQQTDRMASPIILRPIFCTDKKIVAMIAVLNTNPIESVYLKPGKRDLTIGTSIPANQIRDIILSNYPDSPMGSPRIGKAQRSANGSAIEAFLYFVTKERGFVQVRP